MRRDYFFIMPLITILAVIGIFLAVQNTELKRQADTYKRDAVAARQEADQAKKARDDIEQIVKQNRSFTLCGFQVIAKWTRDGLPIENLDLEACTTDSQTQATLDTPSRGTTPQQANTNDPNRTQAQANNSTPAVSSNRTSLPNTSPKNRICALLSFLPGVLCN